MSVGVDFTIVALTIIYLAPKCKFTFEYPGRELETIKNHLKLKSFSFNEYVFATTIQPYRKINPYTSITL